MGNVRIISRLDIKSHNLIKPIQMEGLRVVGDPNLYAKKYYNAGIDEILYIDVVASLYGRNHLSDIVTQTTEDVFVPITVGGGIRSVEDVTNILRCGADKVAVNTGIVKDPSLITRIARKFGSQCMVASIEAKKSGQTWEVYIENGREKTGFDAIEWAQKVVSHGAGEILITSIDQEGTRKGFDVELVSAITTSVSVPVICSGGLGKQEHFIDVVSRTGVDAVAIADAFHYDRIHLSELRKSALDKGIHVRNI